jgi:glycosyltransferase involved in cell wall biosynthesis
MLAISVIIPAYNAAETLAATIDALLAQTYPHWEAIVIDDGSIDATAVIVTDFAAHDQRIRLIQQANAGVITARNVGIAAAQHDWLLFNDADDWIAPTHFAKMVAVLEQDPTVDGVHCGWSRIAADGTIVSTKFAPPKSDMFPDLAYYCTFHVNTCMIRKALVAAIGGFDPRVVHCEDWDLWQRIARQGARFASVPEVLAFYRMQPNSRSTNIPAFCQAGLLRLAYGHGLDPRVPQPLAAYAMGMPAGALAMRQTYFTIWCAGLLIGRGETATALLELIHHGNWPHPTDPIFLEAHWIVENLFETIPIPQGADASQWHQLWPQYLPLIQAFLQALEQHTQIQGLHDLALQQLAQKVLQHSIAQLPLTIGDIHGLTIDIAQPITPPTIPAPAHQIYAQITYQGDTIGWLALPTINSSIAPWTILEVIANQLAEPLLNRLLQYSNYPIDIRSWLNELHPDLPTDQFGVSIIIPAANAAPNLHQTLTALQSQPFADWQAIVVDHGSTDQTLAIAMALARLDSRICVRQQFNQGRAAARNYGLTQAYFDRVIALDAAAGWAPPDLAQITAQLFTHPTGNAVRMIPEIRFHPSIAAPDTIPPQTIDSPQTIPIDITQPIPTSFSHADRQSYVVNIAGQALGELTLPIFQEQLSGTVLADAIAGEYFWWILGEFFRQTRYTAAQSDHHDTIGWTHFLQALFDQPDWETAQFYDTAEPLDRHPITQSIDQPQAQIEISEPLPSLQLSFPLSVKAISVLFTVGGEPFGVVPVPVSDDRITPATLRTTLLHNNSLELCRLCVRVGILGQPINSKRGLRSRLQAAAKQLHPPIDRTQLPPIASCWITANGAADA